MANPNNITLRSDLNKPLSFEQFDANLVEIKALIQDYRSFVDNTYATDKSELDTFRSNIRSDVSDNETSIETIDQKIADIERKQDTYASRLDSLDYEITSKINNINYKYSTRNSDFDAGIGIRYAITADKNISINLPTKVNDGGIVEFFIVDGKPSINTITINGKSKNIEGSSTYTITSDDARRFMFYYNGVQWVVA